MRCRHIWSVNQRSKCGIAWVHTHAYCSVICSDTYILRPSVYVHDVPWWLCPIAAALRCCRRSASTSRTLCWLAAHLMECAQYQALYVAGRWSSCGSAMHSCRRLLAQPANIEALATHMHQVAHSDIGCLGGKFASTLQSIAWSPCQWALLWWASKWSDSAATENSMYSTAKSFLILHLEINTQLRLKLASDLKQILGVSTSSSLGTGTCGLHVHQLEAWNTHSTYALYGMRRCAECLHCHEEQPSQVSTICQTSSQTWHARAEFSYIWCHVISKHQPIEWPWSGCHQMYCCFIVLLSIPMKRSFMGSDQIYLSLPIEICVHPIIPTDIRSGRKKSLSDYWYRSSWLTMPLNPLPHSCATIWIHLLRGGWIWRRLTMYMFESTRWPSARVTLSWHRCRARSGWDWCWHQLRLKSWLICAPMMWHICKVISDVNAQAFLAATECHALFDWCWLGAYTSRRMLVFVSDRYWCQIHKAEETLI